MSVKSLVPVLLLLVSAFMARADDETLLLRQPTVSAEHIAFVYAGDIWIANRDGSSPRRLTVNPSVETNPVFSPDGRRIAFSGNYDGNTDVYVVAIEGGLPERLTFHPGGDVVIGWTPDGRRVLFSSTRYSTTSRYGRLFTVPVDGGFPQPLPMPMAERGSYSPDGARIAYKPIRDAFTTWKHYRGGTQSPIWLFDLKSYEVEAIPYDKSNDTNPIWMGDTIYFLSDRNRTMNLFAYDTKSKEIKQVTHHADYDVKSASGAWGVIVYEQAGRLYLFNPADGSSKALTIRIAPDLPYKRPRYQKVGGMIRNGDISPTGVRAVFEARGEILTVPAKKGDVRNLTRTTGAHERNPAWSPDGRRIAYLSDASGEYQLMLTEQSGLTPPKAIPLEGSTYYFDPKWSPDGEKILYTDKRLNLKYMDLKTTKTILVDTDPSDADLEPDWSPDSKWIAYTKRLDNQYRAVFLYNLETSKTRQVSDNMSDAATARFSRDGKHLFFSASTNAGYRLSGLDMSASFSAPSTRNLYAAVLSNEDSSPFAPESDEEGKSDEKKDDEKKKSDESDKSDKTKADDGKTTGTAKAEDGASTKTAEKAKEKVKVRIDLENIDQRIIAIPVPARIYSNIQTAAEGKLFYIGSAQGQSRKLYCFDMKERKEKDFIDNVAGYTISHDGKSMLYSSGGSYAIVKTAAPPSGGDGKLNTDDMEVQTDPAAEWTQMFNEAWRIQREYFYAPNMHGADWPAVREKYRPFLAYCGHRSDLNFIFGEMFGELVCGHAYVSGGDMPDSSHVPVGLLGADFEIENGLYRIKRIYSGENWNPDLRAPLTEPGVNVKTGDYILAVNARPLRAPANIYSLFENTSGKQTVLQLNDKPTSEGARIVTVVPISDESGLRNRDWVEDNRRKVDQLTGGRVAYVYMPDTGGRGYEYFNRYYFAQLNREAAIIDERFNGGGKVADYVIDVLNRTLLCQWSPRDGKVYSTPNAAIFGPKVMVVNQYAGSGGDAMPHMFRRRGLGKIIGMRTWGGLVGIGGYPSLMDGGGVTAPTFAIFSPDGKWEVENEGVTPDVEIEMTPKAVIEGHDPQLEKAVEVVMEELKNNPVKRAERPPFPERAK